MGLLQSRSRSQQMFAISVCRIVFDQCLLNHSTIFLPNLVWWCIIMRRCVMQKNWFTIINVKATARAYRIKIWRFLLYLLNCWSVSRGGDWGTWDWFGTLGAGSPAATTGSSPDGDKGMWDLLWALGAGSPAATSGSSPGGDKGMWDLLWALGAESPAATSGSSPGGDKGMWDLFWALGARSPSATGGLNLGGNRGT